MIEEIAVHISLLCSLHKAGGSRIVDYIHRVLSLHFSIYVIYNNSLFADLVYFKVSYCIYQIYLLHVSSSLTNYNYVKKMGYILTHIISQPQIPFIINYLIISDIIIILKYWLYFYDKSDIFINIVNVILILYTSLICCLTFNQNDLLGLVFTMECLNLPHF